MASSVLYHCNFCAKSRKQVKKLVSAQVTIPPQDSTMICDECLDLCVQIMVDEGFSFSSESIRRLRQVKELNTSVIHDLKLQPVFTSPQPPQQNNRCFYLGPFSEPFNTIYRDHIVPVVKKQGMRIERADEIYSQGVIVEDIWIGINRAAIVVADVTGKNPNVMYEIGMAHTIGKPVALITQDINDVPFDLRHRRCIIYSHTPRGAQQLEAALSETLGVALGRRRESSS